MEKLSVNQVTEKVIGSAIAVHRRLGPGLLESTCEACLAYELYKSGLEVERQKQLPVVYEKVRLDCGYRIDLMVNKIVIVEVKAVEVVSPVHCAQLLSYLRLSGCTVGLLLNFNVMVLKSGGIRRIVNHFSDFQRPLPHSLRTQR
jgi:GxxExxY protein